jgi:hypothetical protein
VPYVHGAGQIRFPVVTGAGSHPFPFRTRKLSLPPPMVLHPQGCGRVGRCRGLFDKPALLLAARAFLLTFGTSAISLSLEQTLTSLAFAR